MPWQRRALSAIAVLTIAVAGQRMTLAAAGREIEHARMACGDVPKPPVRLHLVDRAGLSADAREELMREALAPWRAEGASLTWTAVMPTRPPGPGEPKDLYVFIEGDAGETADLRHLPMASILFTNGQPTTHITIHAGHVARRLATVRLDDRPLAEQPRMIRDRILGRVLGRAVAHEVGHFLFASREHESAGLMRASHRIDHLMAPGHPAFRLRPAASAGCLVARGGGG
ncbi:MAG: hypothetical protein ABIT71_22235 [Vicinamibacteraceae bacterium]